MRVKAFFMGSRSIRDENSAQTPSLYSRPANDMPSVLRVVYFWLILNAKSIVGQVLPGLKLRNANHGESSMLSNHETMSLINGKLALVLGAAYLSHFYHANLSAAQCWAKYCGRTWIVGQKPPPPEADYAFEPLVIAIDGQSGAVIGGSMKGEDQFMHQLAHRVSEAVSVRGTELESVFYNISWAGMVARSKPTSPSSNAPVLTLVESLGDKWQISRDGTAHCGKRWIRLSRADRQIIRRLTAL
jgi:hypothetical protein